jgi:hypothetical protein
VFTTIVYPAMVGGQMTSSSWWGLEKGHVSSIYNVYFLTEALRMEFAI